MTSLEFSEEDLKKLEKFSRQKSFPLWDDINEVLYFRHFIGDLKEKHKFALKPNTGSLLIYNLEQYPSYLFAPDFKECAGLEELDLKQMKDIAIETTLESNFPLA